MPKRDEAEMTFLEHLEEMRFVILKAIGVFVIAFCGVLIGFGYFNSLMLYPLNSAKAKLAAWESFSEGKTPISEQKMGPVYLEMKSEDGKTTKKDGPYYIVPKDDSFEIFKDFKSAPKDGWYSDIKLRSMSFATPIVVYFYVGFLGALGLSLPVVFYLAAKFIAPGLTNQELKMLRPGVIAAIILFCVGACFAFFFILPMGIAFMSWLSQGMQLEMFPDAQSYYSMVIFVTIAIGVTFQLPLLEFILIYLGVLNVQWLKKNRRIVFLLILIFATVVTPPDALTQISLTIPLYLMYEITLFLGQRARSKKLAREARAERLAELRDERERKEYVEMMAKERLAEEKAEAEESEIDPSIDTSHYSLPDDYDPNEIHPTPEEYGYASYDEMPDGEESAYALDSYINYGNLAKPVPNFSPNWELNKPDLSFMAPDWSLNEAQPPPQEQSDPQESSNAPALPSDGNDSTPLEQTSSEKTKGEPSAGENLSGTTGAKELSESKGEGMDENKPEQQKDSPQIKDENTQP